MNSFVQKKMFVIIICVRFLAKIPDCMYQSKGYIRGLEVEPMLGEVFLLSVTAVVGGLLLTS